MKFLKAFFLTISYAILIYIFARIFGYQRPIYLDLFLLPISVLIPICIGLNFNKEKFFSFLSFERKVEKNDLVYGMVGMLGLWVINHSISNIVFNNFYPEKDIVSMIKPSLPLRTLLFSIILIPFLEETFFRKYLAYSLYQKYGLVKALVFSSMLFSLAHINTENGMFQVFLGGLFFGYVFLKKNSIILIIILHAVYNLITYLIFGNVLDLPVSKLIINSIYHSNGLLLLLSGLLILYFSLNHFRKVKNT